MYTYKPGWAIDFETGQFLAGVPLTFSAAEGGSSLQVYDLNGAPMQANDFVTNGKGKIPYFQADIPKGVIDAGAGPMPVTCEDYADAAAQLPALQQQVQQAATTAEEAVRQAGQAAAAVNDAVASVAGQVKDQIIDPATGKVYASLVGVASSVTTATTDYAAVITS